MSETYSSGEKVFLPTGSGVLEATVEGTQYGRVIISFRGLCSETGRTCVSRNRLFRSREDACMREREASARAKGAGTGAGETPEAGQGTQHASRRNRMYRADEPGDGWARR